MNKGTKIGLAIGGLLVVGVGGFFLYKKMKKKKQEQLNASMNTGGSTGGSSGGSTGGSAQPEWNTNKDNNSGGGIGGWLKGIFGGTPSSSTGGGASSVSQLLNTGCGGAYSNANTFPLKKGSCGSRVVKLQKYMGVTADGKFGSGTESAVKGKQNAVSSTPIGWSAGYGKVSEKDYKALPI